MAYINLDNISLWYPTYTPKSRSIKTMALGKMGGQLVDKDGNISVKSLSNISLELHDGDRLGIIGHNGAGKTTLLRVFSDIYKPQVGTVTIEGSISSFVDITMGMDLEATGMENILIRGLFLGLTFEEVRNLTPSIAEFSELGDFLDMPLYTYSAGMFMRLAFSISTSVQPEIMIMDEMIGAGDASFYKQTVDRMDTILAQTKIMIVATHSNDIISRMCNKVLWLENGRVKGFGEVDELLEAYEGETS